MRLLLPGLLLILLLATACTLAPTSSQHAPVGKGRDAPLTATFLGNTTILIDDGTDQILIDGFLTRPGLIPSAIASLRTHPATVDAALDRARANRLRAVFVTHSHIDHALDAAYVIHRSKRIQKTAAILYGSKSTYHIGRGGDLADRDMRVFKHSQKPENRRSPKDHQTFEIGENFTVTVIPSKHTKTIPLVNDDLGTTIDEPLRQPARKGQYAEGGSYDFLIKHGTRTILIKPSANYLDGALDGIKADTLFLGVSGLGRMSDHDRGDLYRNTVQQVRAKRVIPVHWDNFFCPLSENLPILFPRDKQGLRYLQHRLQSEGRRYELMQGYQTITIP